MKSVVADRNGPLAAVVRWVRLAACHLIVLVRAFGVPGDLDLTFGNGGKVTTALSSDHQDYRCDVAVQGDGRIVVAGTLYSGGNNDFAVLRYTAAGSLDTSFGNGGKVTTDFGGNYDYGHGVVLQSDGKILVAGRAWNGSNYDFGLVRYTAAGVPDLTFGTGGKVITAIGSSFDVGRSVALQSDGKIVVAGYSYDGFRTRFALVRYMAAGALDGSFGTGGKVTTAFSSDAYGEDVAIQNDGKIVVAGRAYVTGVDTDTAFALARYTISGALDVSFSGDGKVMINFGNSADDGYGVAVQSDGKIVVAGASHNGSNYDFALARYTAAGDLDVSFKDAGYVRTAIGNDTDKGHSVILQSDGKIIVAGLSYSGSNYDFAVVRYTPSGALDSSFGNGGKVITAISSGYDSVESVALQSDGKIVAVGASANGSNFDLALARYETGLTLTPLEFWRFTYFGTTNNSGIAADNAAPHGDGIVNLLKYGLVIPPGMSSANSLPPGRRKMYAEGNRLALAFLHDPARTDITLEVQAADQPGGFWMTIASSVGGALFSGPGLVNEMPDGGGINTVEVRDIVNLDAASTRYLRIKVTH